MQTGGVDHTQCIAVGFCRRSSRNVTGTGAQWVAHHSGSVTQGCSRAGGLLWESGGVLVSGTGDREAGVGENTDHRDDFDSVP